ncbi:MAG: DUF2490 domain-containing protein [Bdellovibrionales bacterium]|nr:DUF2490 domain-containing protein [Bdellovibrionales bacterium]
MTYWRAGLFSLALWGAGAWALDGTETTSQFVGSVALRSMGSWGAFVEMSGSYAPNSASDDQISLRGALVYTADADNSFWLGYQDIADTRPSLTLSEHRIWEQWANRYQIDSRWALRNIVRFDERRPVDTNHTRVRFRHAIRLTYFLDGDAGLWTLSPNFEYSFNLNGSAEPNTGAGLDFLNPGLGLGWNITDNDNLALSGNSTFFYEGTRYMSVTYSLGLSYIHLIGDADTVTRAP